MGLGLPPFAWVSEDIAVSKQKQRQVACGCCLFVRKISGFDLLCLLRRYSNIALFKTKNRDRLPWIDVCAHRFVLLQATFSVMRECDTSRGSFGLGRDCTFCNPRFQTSYECMFTTVKIFSLVLVSARLQLWFRPFLLFFKTKPRHSLFGFSAQTSFHIHS